MRKILTKTLTFVLCLSMAITVTIPISSTDTTINPLSAVEEIYLS